MPQKPIGVVSVVRVSLELITINNTLFYNLRLKEVVKNLNEFVHNILRMFKTLEQYMKRKGYRASITDEG